VISVNVVLRNLIGCKLTAAKEEFQDLVCSLDFEQWQLVMKILPRILWRICIEKFTRAVCSLSDYDPRKQAAFSELMYMKELSSERREQFKQQATRLVYGKKFIRLKSI
jgi:hypothetical protein